MTLIGQASSSSWADPAVIVAIAAAGLTAVGVLVSVVIGLIQIKAAKSGDPTYRKENFPETDIPLVEEQAEDPAWKVTDTDLGRFFRAVPAGSADVLVVFVHGILGDVVHTWGKLPRLICEAMEGGFRGFDILSFGYPAGLLHAASIEQGAKSLGEGLKLKKYGYEHLIFVTHSTGGLVVKRMLLDDMRKSLEQLDDPEVEDIRNIKTVVLRTRQVINIAVPHTGGSRLATLVLGTLYHLLYPFFWVYGKLLSASSSLPSIGRWSKPPKGYEYGYNKIVWQLRCRNRDLTRLEDEYQVQRDEFDRRLLPRPLSIEINGSHDTTIDQLRQHSKDDVEDFTTDNPRTTSREDTVSLMFRGTHPTVKEADSVSDGIVLYISSYLDRYAHPSEVALAAGTVTRSLELDRGNPLVASTDETELFREDWRGDDSNG